MTITAKYPGTCRLCGGKIRPGQEIEWERGQKPVHANCSSKSATATATPAAKATAPKAAPAPAVTVTIEGDYALDEHGQLNFRYRLPEGTDRYGRDATPAGFVFHGGDYLITDRGAKLAEALEVKARLIAERGQAVEDITRRLQAGEQFLRIETRSYDGYEYPVLGVSEAISSRLPFRPYYDLLGKLLPWLGRGAGGAYGASLETKLPVGTLISIPELQTIEAAKYNAWTEAHRKDDEFIAELTAARAAGGHIVALKRCWECGLTQVIGEYNDSGSIVRMPGDVYRQAVAAQAAAHRRSAESAGDEALSSAGFNPEPGTKFQFRVVETHYCGC